MAQWVKTKMHIDSIVLHKPWCQVQGTKIQWLFNIREHEERIKNINILFNIQYLLILGGFILSILFIFILHTYSTSPFKEALIIKESHKAKVHIFIRIEIPLIRVHQCNHVIHIWSGQEGLFYWLIKSNYISKVPKVRPARGNTPVTVSMWQCVDAFL